VENIENMDLNLAGSKKKYREKKKYSIITLDLFKPTKNSYPEFDYEQICKEYLNEDESSGEDERFHDREAEQLCKRLQEKYGGKKDKRGRKIRFGTPDDFMDKSAGYDLSDPFIDDSEAYDEHVPSTMDTMKGGFYVNKGTLEFRPKYPLDSESEDEEAVAKKRTAEKRRRIQSDDEEEPMNSSLKPSTSKAISEDKKADSSFPETNIEKNSQQVRLSAAGAPPSSSGNVAVANRRLLAQQLIKRRRLIGQPPSTKITPSPAMKAAMGVKKKLKPAVKKMPTGDGSTEELAGFLKDMTGGEEIALDNFDEGIDVLVEEVARESPKRSRSPSMTPVANSEPKTDKEGAKEEKKEGDAPGSSATTPGPISPAKRPLGRPPGSTSCSIPRPMPEMSDKLASMIETFKQRTKEFGAPAKKIRIPPSLVELCIRIEEQCSAEGFTHHQRTRVFDMISGWVCVQRNSLYIRMKAFKDRRIEYASAESGSANIRRVSSSTVALSSSSSEGAEELEMNSASLNVTTTKTPNTLTQNVVKELERTMKESDASSNGDHHKSPMPPVSGTVMPISRGIVMPNKANAVSTTRSAVHTTETPKTALASAPITSITNLTQIKAAYPTQKTHVNSTRSDSSSVTSKQSALLKTPTSTSKSSPQNPLASLASPNPQMLQLLTALIQQQAQGDSQQQNLAAGLAALQMNAAVLAANQHSEVLAQYQLALNNLAKLSVVPPQQTPHPQKRHMTSSAKSGVVKQKKIHPSTPVSTPSGSRLMPTTMGERMASLSAIGPKVEKTAATRNDGNKQKSATVPAATAPAASSVAPSTAAVSTPGKQTVARAPDQSEKSKVGAMTEEKVAQALAAIKKATETLFIAVGVAMSYSDSEYENEKKRCERDGLPVPAKRFRWTERLRSSLKQLVTVLFFNLEMQCTSVEDIYPTVVQYLFGNILPSFKGRISFEELIAEILRLVPERAQLRTCSRTIAIGKGSSNDNKKSSSSSGSTTHHTATLSSNADSQKAHMETKVTPTPPQKKSEGEVLKSTKDVAADTALNSPDTGQADARLHSDVGAELIVQNHAKSAVASSIGEIQVKANRSLTANVQNRQQRSKSDESSEIKRSNSTSLTQAVNERPQQPIFSPKLTPGQKIILAREAEEREKLLAEKAAREKAEKEREERERERQKKLQEAERLEAAAKEEEAERIAVAEAERKRLEREESEKRRLLEEKLEAERLEEERRRQEEAAEQRRLEAQLEEERRLEAQREEEEKREREQRELELRRIEEAEQKRQEEIDDFLERLSPLDFVDESADVGDRKEESFGVDSQQQPQQSFANMEQPMSHESLHNPSTPSSCGYAAVVESSPSSRDQQRIYGTPFSATQHGSPVFQQASTPATASPQSVHSIPASPLPQSIRSPMPTISSSPSPYNRIQYSPAGPPSLQRYSSYQQQQQQLPGSQNMQQNSSQPNVQGGQQITQASWNQVPSGQSDSFNCVFGSQGQMQHSMTMTQSQPILQHSLSRQATAMSGGNIRQPNTLAQAQYASDRQLQQPQQHHKQQIQQQLLHQQPPVPSQAVSQPPYQNNAHTFSHNTATGIHLQQAQPYRQQQQAQFPNITAYGNTRAEFQRTQTCEQVATAHRGGTSVHEQGASSMIHQGVTPIVQQNVMSTCEQDMRQAQAQGQVSTFASAAPAAAYVQGQCIGSQQSPIYNQQQRQILNQQQDQRRYLGYQQQQQQYNNSQQW
uniref:Hpc2-related domain-containing protein n=4 Tax=Parascaris univalens TaxID=6257 RepID=A0A915ANI2_PARUN